ncbi:MAG: helix-turn-helix domain-containing protein [Bacteroidota bacterium]
MSIEDRIRATREEQGLSQIEFAKQLGINQIEVSRIETGKRKSYTPELVVKISEALGVHIEWLFTGKGQKEILSPRQIDEYLAKRGAELDKMTKEELLLQHERTRSQLKKLEKQLKSILRRTNFDA